MFRTRITHMQADPVTCSYDPAKGGRQTTTVRWGSVEKVVQHLTGRSLYAQGHSMQGNVTTVDDPNGGRWDCFKLAPEWVVTDTGVAHGPFESVEASGARWWHGTSDRYCTGGVPSDRYHTEPRYHDSTGRLTDWSANAN